MTKILHPVRTLNASPTEPSVDLFAATQFLLRLGQIHTFQTFDDSKKCPAFSQVFHGTLSEHQAALVALNKQGAGVFVMVNQGDGIVRPNARTCRTNQNVTAIRSLFVDLDGAPIDPLFASILPPQIIIESSPARAHAYWLVDNIAVGDFKKYQVALEKRFHGDHVCDLARVMRVPGFVHRKGVPFRSRILRLN